MPDLVDAYAAPLKIADRQLAHGRPRRAAVSFGDAMALAFDRQLHFDAVSSPLAEDPQGFTAPLRQSKTARVLRSPRGRIGAAPARGTHDQGKSAATRVLVVTKTNASFLTEVLDLLRESPDFEVRFLDVADHPDVLAGVRRPGRMAEAILTGAAGPSGRVEELFRPHLDWADVVFVEWCRAHAPLLTLIDPQGTRVIVRLHSYEVFTAWPHLVDFSRVDDVLFVSDHLRDLAQTAIPALQAPGAPGLQVLPLSMRLRRFVRPKPAQARFDLGLVGWGSVAKDPLWALDVLERLREQDSRYRLLLIGDAFDSAVSEAAREYGDRLVGRLNKLEADGVVRQVGRTDDVPSALTDVGVILSTSVRESFHAALVEGAASGAVPVVRDWPFFAGKEHGARTLFPTEWIVDSPEQAAERILECAGDESSWRSQGEVASAHALRTWDWEAVTPAYAKFLSRRRR